MAKNANIIHEQKLDFLDKIALFITKRVATMWCFLVFCAISLISLPAAIASHDPVVIVGWLSSNFLQLILLPLIMVGSDLLSRHSETRAELEFETNLREEKENKDILKRLERMEKHQTTTLERIHDLLKYSGR